MPGTKPARSGGSRRGGRDAAPASRSRDGSDASMPIVVRFLGRAARTRVGPMAAFAQPPCRVAHGAASAAPLALEPVTSRLLATLGTALGHPSGRPLAPTEGSGPWADRLVSFERRGRGWDVVPGVRALAIARRPGLRRRRAQRSARRRVDLSGSRRSAEAIAWRWRDRTERRTVPPRLGSLLSRASGSGPGRHGGPACRSRRNAAGSASAGRLGGKARLCLTARGRPS